MNKEEYQQLLKDGRFVGYEVEERKPEPPKSVAKKVREFFKTLFTN